MPVLHLLLFCVMLFDSCCLTCRYQDAAIALMPRMADYEAAIVFSSLVHCGCPIDLFLLQHMLGREPRESFSPGIMADLQSALQLVEQQQLQQLGVGEGVELQLRLGLQQQQQQQELGGEVEDVGSSSGSSGSRWYDPWYDGVQQQQQQDEDVYHEVTDDVLPDVDSLIDQARSEIGAAQNLWQQQQQQSGRREAGLQQQQQQQQEGGATGELQDAAIARRIRQRIAIVEELFLE
jgi:hypothetical protein